MSGDAASTAGCTPQPPKYTYTARQIDIRQLPRINAPVLMRLPRGTGVAVGTCVRGWCGVATSEVVGYAEQAYLTEGIVPAEPGFTVE
jgi:SH3-like domain-containing protein